MWRLILLALVSSLASGGQDHYAILGLGRRASTADIKTAYKRLAKQHHPDKGGEKETFQAVQEAYNTLSDEEKRATYDLGGRGPPRGGGGGHPRYYGQYYRPRMEVDSAAFHLHDRSASGFLRDNDAYFVWCYTPYSASAQHFAHMYDGLIRDFEGIAALARVDTFNDPRVAALLGGRGMDSELFLVLDGVRHYFTPAKGMGGGDDRSLPTNQAEIVAFFFEAFDCEIEWITEGASADAFLAAGASDSNRVVYFKSDQEVFRASPDGIPLDYVRLYKQYRDVYHFAIATHREAGLMKQWEVPSYGRTTVVVKNEGRRSVHKKGGLRPFDSLARFLDEHKASAVQKLTKPFLPLCVGGDAPFCALIVFPAAMPDAEKASYREAAEGFATAGTLQSQVVWANAAAQRELLSRLGVFHELTRVSILVFSTKHAQSPTQGPFEYASLDAFGSRAGFEVGEAETKLGAAARRARWRHAPPVLSVQPDGEVAQGVNFLGFKWKKAQRTATQFARQIPFEMVAAVLVMLFLYGRDEPRNNANANNNNNTAYSPGRQGTAHGRPQQQQQQHQQNPYATPPQQRYGARAPTATPQQPASAASSSWAPRSAPSRSSAAGARPSSQSRPQQLVQRQLELRGQFVVVFFVPEAATLMQIKVPENLMADGKLVTAYVSLKETPGCEEWYERLSLPRDAISVVVLRGPQKKYALIASVTGPLTPDVLSMGLEKVLSGSAAFCTLEDGWPAAI